MTYSIAPGGLAAVLAHPDDESFGCAGALALAHEEGRTTRLLVVTRGEAGSADGERDPAVGDVREAELICAARAIGLDEVSLLDGYPDGGVADEPFERLVDEIAAWLADRRPQAVITFGPHGVTGHPDHIVVGNATRWAVEQLAEAGIAPNAVYVISPIFDPGGNRFDLSPEEQAATHRIEITGVAGRKLDALGCHASQTDTADVVAALKDAIAGDRPIYEGYQRVRPLVPAPHPNFDARLL
ncbi:MAG TPA: PIG-L family deacetylase [Candidatus Limnocylindrales bacterium]|nr:PIG-L family deacetylase [Candidatus Limnocylindrales bacterium]